MGNWKGDGGFKRPGLLGCRYAKWCALLIILSFISCRKQQGIQHYLVGFAPASELSLAQAWQIPVSNFNDQNSSFNPGFTRQPWWLKTVVFNPGKEDLQLLLVLNNPHINELEVYTNGGSRPIYRTGDLLPFASRPVDDRDFVIPVTVPAGDSVPVLLRIAKLNESLQLVPVWYTAQQFATLRQQEASALGIIAGWMMLLLVFAIILWASLHQNIVIIYLLFVLTSIAWNFSNWGLGFQFLWPNWPDFSNKSRPIFMLLSTGLLVVLIRQFFAPPPQYKWAGSMLTGFSRFCFTLCLLTLITSYRGTNPAVKTVFLQSLSVILILAAIFVLVYLMWHWRNGTPLAGYYLAGIGAFLLSGTLVSLYQFGGNQSWQQFVNQYGTSLGMLTESAMLGFAFAKRAAIYKIEKEQLALAMLEKDRKMATQLLQVEEAERQRIGRDLHDSVGSLLGALYLRLQHHSGQQEETKAELLSMVKQAANETRSISHNLVPAALQEKGLVNALQTFIHQLTQAHPQIHFGFFADVNQPIEGQPALMVYRICHELMHNIVKHAAAKNAHLQLSTEEQTLQIVAEDDGKGFDYQNTKPGIGLANLQSRVSYLGGSFHTDSNPQGTTIIIEIPLLKTAG